MILAYKYISLSVSLKYWNLLLKRGCELIGGDLEWKSAKMRGGRRAPPPSFPDEILDSSAMCITVSGIVLMLLTGLELLSPLIIFIMISSILTEMNITTLFDSLTYYKNILSITRVSCVILIGAFIAQYYYTFKKKVQYLRHAANVLFIILTLMVSSAASTTNENNYRIELAQTWSTSTIARDFEKQFHCDGLNFTNVTSSVFCDHQINIEIEAVFDNGRSVGIWTSLFIISISFYYIATFIIVKYTG